MKHWIAFIVMLTVLLLPELALACPVCGTAKEETRMAFLLTTGLMSFLPLGLIGGVVWFLVKRARRLEAEYTAAVEAQASKMNSEPAEASA